MKARVSGLNHITLAVSDLPESIAYYRDILGATLKAEWAKGAYFEIGDLWLCLTQGVVQARQDYTHIAFSCAAADFDALAAQIRAASDEWQSNTSEGASLYFLDPDGHRLELHKGDLDSRLAHYRANPDKGVTVFD